MSHQDLRAGFEAKALAMPGSLGRAATEFENFPLPDPKPDGPYQRFWLLEAAPSNPTLVGKVSSGISRLRGFFQIDLCYPAGEGTGDVMAMADLIAAWFKPPLSITANQLSAIVDAEPFVKPGRLEGDRWIVPIRVSYFANA